MRDFLCHWATSSGHKFTFFGSQMKFLHKIGLPLSVHLRAPHLSLAESSHLGLMRPPCFRFMDPCRLGPFWKKSLCQCIYLLGIRSKHFVGLNGSVSLCFLWDIPIGLNEAISLGLLKHIFWVHLRCCES